MITDATPEARRYSPVRFDVPPKEVERRDGWDVVLAYEGEGKVEGAGQGDGVGEAGGAGEGQGPWLVDLSHRARWDYQDRRIDDHRPLGLHVPPAPREVSIERGLMISRMNNTQASIVHVGPDTAPAMPDEVGYTDTTDAHCCLAVVGTATPVVLEHVSNLDLFPPRRRPPFLTQGPVLHVPCQIVTRGYDGALLTFGRGYGQTFADAMLQAAGEVGLRPGGERVFTDWWLGGGAASP